MKKKEYKKRMEKEKKALKDFQETDTTKSIRNGIIIAVCVLAFLGLMFAFTKVKTGEWNLFTRKNNITYKAEAQTVKVLCGQVLNRSESEYFVLAYDMQDESASLYESILERYDQSSKKITVHKLDLANSRNNICKSDSLVLSNDITKLKLSEPTLLKIKDSKIENSYTDYETIKNTLYSYVD